tara:strand:+ start:575 stop:883 length:309 start_codon:yes stop_codon:yes gene_type:complete
MNKEKQFTSFDTEGPTDFDYVGFHLDTIKDILELIDICHIWSSYHKLYKREGLSITSEKLDELKHYTDKLKRYVGQGPYHVYHSQPLPKGGKELTVKVFPRD